MMEISYSDGENIQTLLIHEVDIHACRIRLQEEGYLIVGEEKVPAPRELSWSIKPRSQRMKGANP
ncbi:MAG: hypothetical protein WC081_02440 [Candidatus Ratteibacteria bacterium]|jgi:hypothetical protein